MRKAKEKESNDLESLNCLVKSLTTEMDELKQRTNETTMRSMPRRFMSRKNVASGNNNNQPTKSGQSSNMVLNIKKIVMDSYCRFQNEHHSEKTCPQRNQGMRSFDAQLFGSVMFEEQAKPDNEEATIVDEAPGTGHVVNMYRCVLSTHKITTDKEHPSDGPA